jgi:hypothetical protein
MMTEQQRRESLRTELLAYLANRPASSFEPEVLLQRLIKTQVLEFTPVMEDLAGALAFLRGSEFITLTPHAHGATPFYQVTSTGVLAHERGTLNPRPL